MLLGSGQAESHRTAAIGIFQKAASLQALMSDMQVTQTATVYQKYFNGSKLQHLYAVCIYIYIYKPGFFSVGKPPHPAAHNALQATRSD